MKKHSIAAIAAASVFCLSTAGCSGDATPGATTAEVAESTASREIVTEFTLPTYAEPTEPVDLSKGVTDTMMQRAVMNEGNLARLSAAMKKAESGEAVTIGFIGGSITQGSSSTSQQNCYAYKTYQWWADKFPGTEVTYLNAGIGATDSYLGVHRVERDLLSGNPDVVVVEFSVNDTNRLINQESYESLVRKILSHESSPALILLCTTMEDGTSFQELHAEVGFNYDLPIISYHDVVYPEVAAGTLAWSDISPDNIHPNDAGHDIIGQIMSNYFNSVYDKLDSITDEYDFASYETVTKDRYANGGIYDNTTLTPASIGSYTEGTGFDRYKNGWATTDGAEPLVFEVEARNIGIVFYRKTDGSLSKYDVFVDGERKATLDGDFTGGWGSYSETCEVFRATDGSTAAHTVEIRPAEGSTGGCEILSVLIS